MEKSKRKSSHNLTEPGKNTISEALAVVGDHHKYQYRVFIIIAMLSFITMPIILLPAFMLKKPEFLCKGNIPCSEDDGGCIDQILHPNEHLTVTTYFKLYCEKRNLRDFGQSVIFFGALIGINIFSYLSDNFGRIFAIKTSLMCLFIGILGYNLSHSVFTLFFFSFFCGSTFSFFILMFVIIGEISNTEFRQKAGVCFNLFAAFGEIYFVLLAYLIKEWRVLVAISVTIPLFIMFFPLFYFVKESPKFLWNKNPNEAINVLNYIAKINKKPQLTSDFTESMITQNLTTSIKDTKRIYSLKDLVTFRSLRPLTIGASMLFFTIQVVYYGTEFAIADLGGNLYLNSLIVAFAETVSYIITIFSMTKMKRKKTLLICTVFTAIFSLGFYFVEIPAYCKKENVKCIQKTLETILISLSRLVNGIVYAVIFTYIPELFPVTVKSLGFGLSKFFGIIGVIISPAVVDFSDRIHLKPMIVIGIIVVLGIPAILMLKETLNKEIPNEIYEIENLKKRVATQNNSYANAEHIELSFERRKSNIKDKLRGASNSNIGEEGLQYQDNSSIKY